MNFVIFYAPEKAGGRVMGGTATAIRLAKERGVPTYNLWHPETMGEWQLTTRREERSRLSFWQHLFGGEE